MTLTVFQVFKDIVLIILWSLFCMFMGAVFYNGILEYEEKNNKKSE